jgi:hypothetical protein
MNLVSLGLVALFSSFAGGAFAASALAVAHEVCAGNVVFGIFAGVAGFGGGFVYLGMAIEEIKEI